MISGWAGSAVILCHDRGNSVARDSVVHTHGTTAVPIQVPMTAERVPAKFSYLWSMYRYSSLPLALYTSVWLRVLVQEALIRKVYNQIVGFKAPCFSQFGSHEYQKLNSRRTQDQLAFHLNKLKKTYKDGLVSEGQNRVIWDLCNTSRPSLGVPDIRIPPISDLCQGPIKIDSLQRDTSGQFPFRTEVLAIVESCCLICSYRV